MQEDTFFMEDKSLKSEAVVVHIQDLSVLKTVVSIKCSLRTQKRGMKNFLEDLRNQDLMFSSKIESLKDSSLFVFWNCKVRSINIQRDFHFVVHFVPVDLDKTQRLIQIKKSGLAKITFLSPITKEGDTFYRLLNEISNKTGKKSSEIIKELTTFTTSSGKTVQGKDSLDQLSVKQKKFLLQKLKRMKYQLEKGRI